MGTSGYIAREDNADRQTQHLKLRSDAAPLAIPNGETRDYKTVGGGGRVASHRRTGVILSHGFSSIRPRVASLRRPLAENLNLGRPSGLRLSRSRAHSNTPAADIAASGQAGHSDTERSRPAAMPYWLRSGASTRCRALPSRPSSPLRPCKRRFVTCGGDHRKGQARPVSVGARLKRQ